MTYYKKIVGEYCYISPTSLADSEYWSSWLNISMEEARSRINKNHESMKPCFSIIDSQKDTPIGFVSFEEINQLYQNGSISIFNASDENWTSREISDALQVSLDFAFNCLNMHSISLWIPENESLKIQCFMKAGFKETARRRQSVKIHGNLFDNIHLDILSREYSSVFMGKYLEEMDNYTVG